MREIKIAGIIDSDPFSFKTWSGSSRFFFNALKNKNVLETAIDTDPGNFYKRLSQLKSFYPDKTEWKRRYLCDTFLFSQRSKEVIKKLGPITNSFNTMLQVGAWYNVTDSKYFKDKLFCSYHDGNRWTQLKRPDTHFNLDKSNIKNGLAYEKKLYDRLDLIFPMSNWLGQSFVKDFKCDPSKVIPVGAGINLNKIIDVGKKDYSNPNILFVGIEFKRKGGEVVLEAFRKVRREIPGATLTIIGPELTNLPDGVLSLGRILKNTADGERQICEAYANASLFVMPSFYEPFGIVFAEAMAHKLPCIGADSCAMPEIIENGKTGFIIPIGGSKVLADRMLDLLKNESQMREYGEAGYQRYLENYTWDVVTQKIIDAVKIKLG